MRNYDLFAILAGVRNGAGFASCDTGDAVEPIAENRGLPEDMSEALYALIHSEEEDAEGWIGNHSFSHITLRELLEHDWGAAKTNRGFVDLEDYKKCLAEGKKRPDSYCGDVWGKGVKKYTVAEMRRKPLTLAQLEKRKVSHLQL